MDNRLGQSLTLIKNEKIKCGGLSLFFCFGLWGATEFQILNSGGGCSPIVIGTLEFPLTKNAPAVYS